MKNFLFVISLFLITAIVLSGCATVRSAGRLVTDEDYLERYSTLVSAVQVGQRETVNAKNCVVLGFTDINTQIGLANLAMQAEVARTEAYAATVRDFFDGPATDPQTGEPVINPATGTTMTHNEQIAFAQKQLAQQLAAYNDASGNPLPPEQIDLAKLANQGAMPFQLALNVNVVALTYTQAPLPPANFTPVENAQRVTTEKTNMIFACAKTANDAVSVYNIERAKVTGEIAAKLAEILHLSDLPQTLSYFELQGPTSPPVVPTFGAP